MKVNQTAVLLIVIGAILLILYWLPLPAMQRRSEDEELRWKSKYLDTLLQQQLNKNRNRVSDTKNIIGRPFRWSDLEDMGVHSLTTMSTTATMGQTPIKDKGTVGRKDGVNKGSSTTIWPSTDGAEDSKLLALFPWLVKQHSSSTFLSSSYSPSYSSSSTTQTALSWPTTTSATTQNPLADLIEKQKNIIERNMERMFNRDQFQEHLLGKNLEGGENENIVNPEHRDTIQDVIKKQLALIEKQRNDRLDSDEKEKLQLHQGETDDEEKQTETGLNEEIHQKQILDKNQNRMENNNIQNESQSINKGSRDVETVKDTASLNVLKSKSGFEETKPLQDENNVQKSIRLNSDRFKVENKDSMGNSTEDVVPVIRNHTVPSFLQIMDWSNPEDDKQPAVVNTAPLQTVSGFIRVCVEATAQPIGTHYLQSKGLWDFELSRDLQMALMVNKELGLIDVGAGIGVYSLTAAHLHRRVLSIETVWKNTVHFRSSVKLNHLQDYVALITNTLFSERRTLGQRSKTFSTITINDLSGIVSFNSAILRLNMKSNIVKNIQQSDQLFSRLRIPFVFLTWPKDLPFLDRKRVAEFFYKMQYVPKDSLHGKQLAAIRYDSWPNSYIVWEKIRKGLE